MPVFLIHQGYQGKGLYCAQLEDPRIFKEASVTVPRDCGGVDIRLLVWNGTGEPLFLLSPTHSGIRRPYRWKAEVQLREGADSTVAKMPTREWEPDTTCWNGEYYKYIPSVDESFLRSSYWNLRAEETLLYKIKVPLTSSPLDADYVDLDITVYFEGYRHCDISSDRANFTAKLRRKVRFKYNHDKTPMPD